MSLRCGIVSAYAQAQPSGASSRMTAPVRKAGTYHAVLAGFLGWTLDAFDFFVIVFLYDTLAREFSVSKKAIIFTTTATLAMRPVGALLFGVLADRYRPAHSVDGQRHFLFHDRSWLADSRPITPFS